MRYGFGFQGSKNQIAEWVLSLLPQGERFVDLFGGGFAMSHCAILSNKYKTIFYNDLDKLAVDLSQKAINGFFDFEKNPQIKRWISKNEFNRLKNIDGYVKYVWSFSCGGKNYLYGEYITEWKKASWEFLVNGDKTYFSNMGIDVPQCNTRAEFVKFIKENKDELQKKYYKWYFENVLSQQKSNIECAIDKEYLKQYLRQALKDSGLSITFLVSKLGSVASHYFKNSQWSFPTEKKYEELKKYLNLDKSWDETGFLLKQKTKQKNIKDNCLLNLQSLDALERLQSLERLQNYKNLSCNIQFNCGSYLNYEYQEGDVVYCDPPYENTRQYEINNKKATKEEYFYSEKAKRTYKKTTSIYFDSKEFYDWVATRPYKVYFSSYEISDNRFYLVGKKQKRSLFNGRGSGKLKNECLYCNMPC